MRPNRKNSVFKGEVEEVLSCASHKGDGPLIQQVVYQHLRHNGGDVHHVDEGEVATGKYMGCEVLISADQKYHDPVGHQCSKDNRDDGKK